jgi:YVTN family beta-propeller protein
MMNRVGGWFRITVIVASIAAAIVGSVLLATRGTGDHATTRGVAVTLRVPDHPGSVAAGPDALWFALADAQPPIRDRPLLRLDLASGAIQRSLLMGGQTRYLLHDGNRLLVSTEHVGGDGSGPSVVTALDWRSGRVLVRRRFPGPIGSLARAGEDVWALQVRPGTLLRLDPVTLAPTAAPLRLSNGRALGLAAGLGYIWATVTDTGDIVRVDPARRTIKRVHVGGSPLGIVVAGGSVWVADSERGEVVRRESQTLGTVGQPIHVGADPAGMETAGRYLFVGDANGGTVTRIDFVSGKRTGSPIRIAEAATDAPAFAFAPSGRSVWVSSFASNTLTRISATPSAAPARAVTASSSVPPSKAALALPRAGKVVAEIPVPPGGGAITAGEGAVWAVSDATSTLMRIDPVTNRVVKEIKIDSVGDAVAGHGAVWLSHPDEDTVSRIDARTTKVSATIHVGWRPAGVAISPDAVWVANAYVPSVSRIDPATNRVVATIKVGPALVCCADHMGLIAAAGSVWVAVPMGNRIVRIDQATNEVTEIVKLPYSPCAYMAAVESALWSAGGICADLVARIDPRTKKLTAKQYEPHPVGVAFAFGRVWVAVLDSGNVDQIDPRTGRVAARLPVGGKPVRLVVGFGSIWINDDKGRVLRISPSG